MPVTVKDAGINIPRLQKPEQSEQPTLGLKFITEFYNKCHNPAGDSAGGQFCSGAVDAGNLSASEKKAVSGAFAAIQEVHELPKNLSKVYVEMTDSDVIGSNVDGTYNSGEDRILLNSDKDNNAITFVHEFGHHLSLSGEGNFSLNQFLDRIDRSNPLRAWKEAVYNSDTIQGLREREEDPNGVVDPYYSYLLDEREIFARAYTQWIVLNSNNATLKRQFKELDINMRWSDKEFEPIAAALDRIFTYERMSRGDFKSNLLTRFNAAISDFHLQGQHDQSTHGNWSTGDEPQPLAKTVNKSAAQIRRRSQAVADFGGSLSALGDKLIIKTDDLNDPEISTHLEDLAGIPEHLHKRLVDNGGAVIVGKGAVTDLHEPMKKFAGVTPRGYDSGSYDQIQGVYHPPSATLVLGTFDEKRLDHYALHEYGHAMDHLSKKVSNLSLEDKFRAPWRTATERGTLNEYLNQGQSDAGASEFFAESFKMWALAKIHNAPKERLIRVMMRPDAIFTLTEDEANQVIDYMEEKFNA